MEKRVAPSIISADLIIHGTLISSGDIQIDGKVDGEIRANALDIGDKAILVGFVYAEEAVGGGLEMIVAQPGISADLYEMVTKMLG